MIRTAYVRHRGELPETYNCAIAIQGFDELGIKVIPYYGFGDIEDSVECGPEALVLGYIGDVHKALVKMGIPIPPSEDYPDVLKPYLGRGIWGGTLSDIRGRNLPGVFVKPQAQKLFTGFVWKGTHDDRIRLATYPDETPCWFADPVEFVSEYRVYVIDGLIAAVRQYRGDWSVAPSKVVVDGAVNAFVKSGKAPRGCAIDFGVTDQGRTLLVEVNDGFALGNYGLNHLAYARLVEARWEQFFEGSDENQVQGV